MRQIGRTFIDLGTDNPRLNAFGLVDTRLSHQIRQWQQEDPAPGRVKPVPVQVLHHVFVAARASGLRERLTLAYMIYIGFFFLCRPGEYTAASEGSRPFRYCDVRAYIGQRRLDIDTAPAADLRASTFTTLTFTNQKNCVPGEVVGQSRSGSSTACPVVCIIECVLHLRSVGAPRDTPLCAFSRDGTLRVITSAMVTDALRQSTAALFPVLGLDPAEVSARSLRAAGAMAMMCADIDPLRTQMLGRWRSDTMIRYLHLQAFPRLADIAPRMLRGGDYSFLPGRNVPEAVAALDAEADMEAEAEAARAAAAIPALVPPPAARAAVGAAVNAAHAANPNAAP